MKWRVIPLETNSAAKNMALDEAICDEIAKEMVPPTIRFYRWQPSAVSIGYFQSLNDEVDLKKCKADGVDYVRRRTGGGAVYHDYEGEITYSIMGPESLFPKGITESYKQICGYIIDGLGHLDIKAEFAPINDIIVEGKKISGNAQTRRNGVLLQHGTILYDLDVKKMLSLLIVGADKISDKMIAAVEERVTRVQDHAKVTREQTYEALKQAFIQDKEFEIGKFTSEEMNLADKLMDEKYSADEWNAMR